VRKITPLQILLFAFFASAAALLAAGTAFLLLGNIPLGDFRGVLMTLAGLLLLEVYAASIYRLYLRYFPLRPGEVQEGSSQEFIYHIHVLFFLVFFYPIIRSGFWPAPVMRLIYQSLGARLGPNTYSQGIIHDPIFVEIGANSTVGQSALLIPHVIEGRKLAHYPIRIGNDVTVGALAAILPGVQIEDGSTVATGAVVTKGTRIGRGEVWAGVPAKRLR
jgi:Hexapeptide repeat of succinyl-transferase